MKLSKHWGLRLVVFNMLLIDAWKNKKSAIWGIVIALIVLFWPAIPLRGLDIWMKTLFGLFPTNVLYPILIFLIASFVALFIYNKECKTCNINNTTATSASLVGVLLGACPACIPALAFFLPLSVTVTLSYFSWAFLLASIIILTFVIYKMNGFRK